MKIGKFEIEEDVLYMIIAGIVFVLVVIFEK